MSNSKGQTEKYVSELIGMIQDPYSNASSGDMPAPGTSTGAAVYSSEGSSTIACDALTRSVIAVYDPEVTLRRGQPAVHMYERNSAGSVIAVQSMNVGRPSNDFLAGGVISSSLQAANTSSIDTIAGSQTAAVLFAVPTSLAKLKSTDLAQIVLNKEKDIIQNVSSKSDSTRTDCPTDHSGTKTALLRSGARAQITVVSNLVAASSTAAQGFIAPSAVIPVNASPAVTPSNTATDETDEALFWTGRDASINPFNLASYVGKISLNMELAASGETLSKAKFFVGAYDASGGLLNSTEVILDTGADMVDTTKFDAHLDVTLKSTTYPIANVGVWVSLGAIERTVNVQSGLVEAEEETSDIPVRGVHVVVFEGLNGSASLNFHAANLLTGVPDSTNAFIANSANELTIDSNIVTNMLQTYRQSAPRAYTGAGKEASNEMIGDLVSSPAMAVKMSAFSFSDIGNAFKRVAGVAKATRRDVSNVARTIQPGLQVGGGFLSTGALGPEGQAVGAGMLTADAAINRARRAGLISEGRTMGVNEFRR